MELSVLALQAVNIALYAIDKVSGGALEKAGADVLGFLEKRFQGKLQIEKSEPKLLEAAILSEAEWDRKVSRRPRKTRNSLSTNSKFFQCFPKY
jgi:hypothetical protein